MIIATAGHVDHGKTLLVKALTGVDTDRLPEEKKRGLTIDLGFAYLRLDERVSIGMIDVPGHERFVHNMLCGVAGVDAALFIIAADDGPMPQTREHLAILDLLDVRQGIVALTKIDRVPPERIEEVKAEITQLMAPTSLAGAPIFPVSAVTGEGVPALKARLQELAHEVPPRAEHGNFRLAIDRAFTVPGAGLVVTGTVFSGRVATAEQVSALLAQSPARIRNIHAQNAQSSHGRAGERCALNLASTTLDTEHVARGDWIVRGALPGAARKLDARLRLLAGESKPLQNWTPVHVHLGAANVTARIATLEGPRIAPGQSGLVQIVLDRPLGAVWGDRFIVRDQSAQRTLGGGRVIDVYPPLRGRAKPERIAHLHVMEEPDTAAALRGLLDATPNGLNLGRFSENRNLTAAELTELGKNVAMRAIALKSGTVAFALDRWQQLRAAVLGEVTAWHQRSPEQAGAPEERLLGARLGKLSAEISSALVVELVSEKALARTGAAVHLPTHRPRVNSADEALWNRILATLQANALRPPSTHEITAQLRADAKKIQTMLERAARTGAVHRVSDARFYVPQGLDELAQLAQKLVENNAQRRLTVAAFRDQSGLGRNVTIEVLEYFDRVKFTRRVGDAREIVRSATGLFSPKAT